MSGAPAGWRLPNVKELESMVERSCASPAVDAAAFPASPLVNFWSSTPGWAVSFNDGSVLSGQTASTAMAVRYVRGGDAATANNFDAGPGVSTNCTTNVPQDRTAAQLAVNSDSTVTDLSTGLTWKRCSEGTTYSAGRCNAGTLSLLNWQQATELSTAPANALDGWRVPNVKELESLVDRGCANPAVNGGRFPDQPAVDFWSSTPGWAVSLNDGSVLSGQTLSTAKAVRMVKGGAGLTPFTPGALGAGLCTTQAPADFKLREWQENADKTLYDARTGLTWDRCVLGQSWSVAANGCVGTPEALTWSQAHFRANGAIFLASNGWRVPNVKELESIVDRRCALPALNPEFFRGNKETLTWSSTPGWAVNMADGSVVSGQSATFGMAVRLVRGGRDTTGYSAALPTVPGVVVGGPIAGVTEVAANIALLLPTAANQRLIFVTHGWNSNSGAWPAEMARILCARLGATLNSGLLASASQSGVSDYCQTPQWRVVAYNWSGAALDIPGPLPGGAPQKAFSNAREIGERLGKTIGSAASQYELVHLIGHSAGSNMVHEMGRLLRPAGSSTPTIVATFLDPYCPNSDRCDFGYWSDWSENYYDSHQVFAGEGTQTRMKLCNAVNFDVSNTYPIANEAIYDAMLVAGAILAPIPATSAVGAAVLFAGSVRPARHAWPYQCYVQSAGLNSQLTGDFNIGCLGQQAGNVGFGLSYFSYLGFGPGTPSTFISARTAPTAFPKQSLFTQTEAGAFGGGQSIECGVGSASSIVSTLSAVGSAISTAAGTVALGVLARGSTCASSSFVAPAGLIGAAAGTTIPLITCTTPTQKSSGVKAAGVEPVTSWSVLDLNVARRTNQIRFTVQFTQPVNAVLTAYIDDAQVYRTTQDLRGTTAQDTGWVDVPAMERGTHKISFRLDSVDGAESSAEVSAVQLAGAAVCDLDIDGDGATTLGRDGVLLLRYLMGFRGSVLTAGLGITDANAAQAIADYVGSAAQFDVFGRSPGTPTALADGLVMLRLMTGVADDALLSGVALPSGTLFATSTAVRANVNNKCGTRF